MQFSDSQGKDRSPGWEHNQDIWPSNAATSDDLAVKQVWGDRRARQSFPLSWSHS